MCGIAGIFSYGVGAPAVSRAELLATRDAMLRRGPDGDGAWIAPNGRIGLAHRRLAIIDLSDSGAQPMSILGSKVWITFNGEIYNFRELRTELEARGHRFRSTSDTEVLLYLYLEYGAQMVEHLRGMFAFGIWDDRQQSLFLARDPFGIKPLYYADTGNTLRFASQVKALLAGGVDPSPDPAGHAGFFIWGSVPEPFTTYEHVKALPAGSSMLIDRNGPSRPHHYFSLREEFLKAEASAVVMRPSDVHDSLSAALYDSVKHHLVSDVPVGLFLSAGIDSSAMAAVAAELQPSALHAVTLGFREFVGTLLDETVWAGRIASTYGLTHHCRWIGEEHFREQLGEILGAMDQPSTDGVNTWFVSRAAAQVSLKVALSGLGGDELFGGYPSFRDVPRLERLPAFGRWSPSAARWSRKLLALLLPASVSPKLASVFEFAGNPGSSYLLRRALYMPWELGKLMDPDMAALGLERLATLTRLEDTVRDVKHPHLRVAGLEMAWYMRNQLLRDSDWAGMAHSLEIRVPLVDVPFFRSVVAAIVGQRVPNKSTLARLPRAPLPEDLIARAKTGFAVPVAKWIGSGSLPRSRGLRGWARRVNHTPEVGYRVVGFLADSFGGRGGIALYCRDLCQSIAAFPQCKELVVLQRRMVEENPSVLPRKITLRRSASNGTVRYLVECAKAVFDRKGIDAIVCGHINLLPLAALAKWLTGAPLLLCLYGIEAWGPPRRWLTKAAIRCVDEFVSISEVTRTRFAKWAGVRSKFAVLPNAIHLAWYSPGPKDNQLLARYGLLGRTVLMTMGRLVDVERYKGFDQVLEVLPNLLKENPDLAYLIVGEGNDRPRLQAKASELGIESAVKFTGYIDETEKASHFRLADAYVMPSSGEGFGFVLLEALACGVPVLGSTIDGTREALRNGQLGILVDPQSPEELSTGIVEALKAPRGVVPEGLSHFSYTEFERRSHVLLDGFLHGSSSFNRSPVQEQGELAAR
jgi:asparagine synthase (glutamine-hydrolysing)